MGHGAAARRHRRRSGAGTPRLVDGAPRAVSVKIAAPNIFSGIQRYFGSGMVRGIAPVYVGGLVKGARMAVLTAPLQIGLEQRWLPKIGIDVHQDTGEFEGAPQRRRHLHDGLRGPGFGNPRADLPVLLARYQSQAQHLVECFHEAPHHAPGGHDLIEASRVPGRTALLPARVFTIDVLVRRSGHGDGAETVAPVENNDGEAESPCCCPSGLRRCR